MNRNMKATASQHDYSKLTERIKKIFGSQKEFSKAIGLSERSVSLKMNGKVDWKQGEIVKACKLLNLGVSEITEYFFVRTE